MKHIGITIGPIYETISLTSSPAGLWAASYLFSHISRRLCEQIVSEKLVTDETGILSPYFSSSDELAKKRDGIGMFHDRIIFKPNPFFTDEQSILSKVQEQFEIVTKEVGSLLSNNDDANKWFSQYFRLHAVCFESKQNPILDSAKFLDAIELEKQYPIGDFPNPLSALFESADKNTQIREKVRDGLGLANWPFKNDNVYCYYDELGNKKEHMPDMADITGRRTETNILSSKIVNGEKMPSRVKINSYYAIVQSDGDHFGDYIKTQFDPRQFSKKCFNYCADAAKEIQQYGGVTIYAGGDDLLFIAPLVSTKNEGDNLLSLLKTLQKRFIEQFDKETGLPPTISFGVAICYYKYPLYEAFMEAYKMLFEQAKTNRNAAGFSLLKHSGQAIRFVLEDFSSSSVVEKLQAMLHKNVDDMLKSISTKIWQHQVVFLKALLFKKETGSTTALENIFNNTFDSSIHDDIREKSVGKAGGVESADEIKQALSLLNEISRISSGAWRPTVREVSKGELTPENHLSSEEKSLLCALDALLRFVKFWYEKGDEENAENND